VGGGNVDTEECDADDDLSSWGAEACPADPEE